MSKETDEILRQIGELPDEMKTFKDMHIFQPKALKKLAAEFREMREFNKALDAYRAIKGQPADVSTMTDDTTGHAR